MLAELIDVVGRDHVLTEAAAIAPYCVDWSGRFRGPTAVVVRPGSTAEVAAVVHICREKGLAVVPQGGNTGLVGGSVPLHGEIVLSLGRLSEVVAGDGHLRAGAGATLATVHRSAAAMGWTYGVDFASRDRATVGGSIATNAGGLRVLRYGPTRAQLLGVEVVLGNGAVVTDLGGPHLPSLVCGSEGTLGVVTAATLRLVPRADHRLTALVAFLDLDAAVAAAADVRRHVRALEAVELILDEGVRLVCAAFGLPSPFPRPHPAYLLCEAADHAVSPQADLAAAIESMASVTDVVVAAEADQRAGLWRYREQHSQAVNTLGPPHKLDVSLPMDRLGAFLGMVPAIVRSVAPQAQTWVWGHVAEGNVHVNVTGLDPNDETVDDIVLERVLELGGSISAEHGIGTAKRVWWARSRSREEIEAFRALKRALDPDGILNPNVLLPPPTVRQPE